VPTGSLDETVKHGPIISLPGHAKGNVVIDVGRKAARGAEK